MKHLPSTLVLFVAFTLSPAQADPPAILSHQGRIAVGGENFDGTGHFKFSLVKDAGLGTEAILWHHDGTATAATEPASAAALPVTKGHYAFLLGEDNPIGPAVFGDNPDVSLRIWFSADGSAFEQLAPDRRLASAAYALSAGTVSMVSDDSVGTDKLQDSAVTSAKIAGGAITGAKLATGSVDGTKILDASIGLGDLNFVPGDITGVTAGTGMTGGGESGGVSLGIANAGVGATQLANGAVTESKLAVGAVTGPKLADGSVGVAKRAAVTVGSGLGQLALSGTTPGLDFGEVAYPVDPSALAWWRAEGNTTDALGNFNGTGSPGYAAGVVGQAFNCSGGQFIDCGNGPALQLKQGTWECWVNTPGGTGTRRIAMGKLGTMAFGIQETDHLYVYHYLNQIVTSTTVADGTWHHIAVTFTLGGTATLYVDGSPVITAPFDFPTHGNPLIIGAENTSGGFPFPGLIDEPTVYSTILSSTQLRSIYVAGAHGKSLPVAGVNGAVPALSASLAVTGNRPVLVGLRPAPGGEPAWLGGLPSQGIGELLLKRDGTIVGRFTLGIYPNLFSPGSIRLLDDGVLGGGPQTVNYGIEVQATDGGVGLSNLQLYAIEQ